MPSLINLPLLLKSSISTSFPSKYLNSGDLRIYLLMIFYFKVKLDYESLFNNFILSDNLTSIFQDSTMIEKKLQENLAL